MLQDGREYQATSHFLYMQMLYGVSVQGCWGEGRVCVGVVWMARTGFSE